MILDLMLPGKNGEELIKELKALRNTPVIIVSAKDGIDSKVELLRSGADDYLTKPFDIRELEARVEVCLRKYKENGSEADKDGENNAVSDKKNSAAPIAVISVDTENPLTQRKIAKQFIVPFISKYRNIG